MWVPWVGIQLKRKRKFETQRGVWIMEVVKACNNRKWVRQHVGL